MKRSLFTFFIALLCISAVTAQSITGKITDAVTGTPLSYATIEVNGENLISNSEGNFTLAAKNSDDALVLKISFLGYNSAQLTVAQLKRNGNAVPLQPAVFELENLNITNVKPNADSIMMYVKKNLAQNYKRSESPLKNMIFYRESSVFKPKQLDIELDKSTGFKKKELKEANIELQAFTSKLITNPPQEFTEMLCNYYTATKTVKGKPTPSVNFEVLKAIKLKDRKRSVEMDELQETAAGILFKHLDTTKYYRIKSGWFGTRDTVIGPKTVKKEKAKAKETTTKVSSAESGILSFISRNSIYGGYRLDFIHQQEWYDYSYERTIQLPDDTYAYVIKFKPRKRKGIYTGTLYVSDTDYAVVRADYDLVEGKIVDGINLKLILGVKQQENLSRGTLIYKKRVNGSGYYLQYGSIETGEYVYINRPLKFIEITDGEKDVAAFDLKVETNIRDKEEYFSMAQEEITEADFDAVTRKDFSYQILSRYDASVWKEYSTIEPLEEMKQFKALE